MNRTLLIGVAFSGAAFFSVPVPAQITQQTVAIAKVDVTSLAAGYRASKVIGSSVTNDKNETIGTIEDLLVSPDGKEPFAVLSIGGFLGVGSHMVVVPFDTLKVVDKKLVLPGGTKDTLRALPEFKYAGE
jgi:PRC-barrel domain